MPCCGWTPHLCQDAKHVPMSMVMRGIWLCLEKSEAHWPDKHRSLKASVVATGEMRRYV